MDSNKLIANKYRIITKIGSGSFGSIFKGINVRTNEKVAIKIENVSDELKLLKHESNIYRILSNIAGVPKIKWYGKDGINPDGRPVTEGTTMVESWLDKSWDYSLGRKK